MYVPSIPTQCICSYVVQSLHYDDIIYITKEYVTYLSQCKHYCVQGPLLRGFDNLDANTRLVALATSITKWKRKQHGYIDTSLIASYLPFYIS